MKRRNKSGLSDEDAALWAHVTRNVSRIAAKKRALHPAPAAEPLPKRSPVLNPGAHAKPVHPTPPRMPVQAPIEPRKVRRIARGRDEIEARIDLHGMRQVEAHGTLRAFLLRAYRNGLRTVLVITGKGREAADDLHLPFDMFQERDRGVLRRNVPRWLAEPDLRAIVVGYTSAHAKHGGDGAFYVQLRNPERFRG